MITYPVAVSMTQWSTYLWECLRSGENETEVEAPMKSGKRCHEASYALLPTPYANYAIG